MRVLINSLRLSLFGVVVAVLLIALAREGQVGIAVGVGVIVALAGLAGVSLLAIRSRREAIHAENMKRIEAILDQARRARRIEMLLSRPRMTRRRNPNSRFPMGK